MSDEVEEVDVWFASSVLDTASTRVQRCRSRAGLSELFEIELYLVRSEELPLDRDAVQELLRAPCAVAFGEHDAIGEPIYGVVREWELLDATPGYQNAYRAIVVPRLWYLTRTVRSRVFQNVTVPDVVEAVLAEAGLGDGYTLALNGSYPTSEYVVQWEESDFDFVARLCEREGIFFCFDFAGGTDQIVFGDSNDAFADALEPTIPYLVRRGTESVDEGIYLLGRRHRVVSHRVVVRDSNYRTPLVPLQNEALVHDDGLGLVALYGDHFADDAGASRIATIRAQELAVEEEVLFATGHLRSLRPGQTFELTSHPDGELDGQRYLVVGAERRRRHPDGDDGDRFVLLPLGVPYRPPRVTALPRILGLMHARVDGEQDGTPAPIDDQGRYRVLLPFDGVGELGGRATRWIRRAQVYAGPAYGMHFPLHIGTEVLLAHLGGDPDRPVIVGAVPNPATASPVIDANATQSIVRTKGNIVEEWEDDA
ncbi:MAG: type VI secretion system tip protein VgrG [Myxococcales bacterium]|nr:type VI secretion system tip protein VgrG [Myxococcales bacterium]